MTFPYPLTPEVRADLWRYFGDPNPPAPEDAGGWPSLPPDAITPSGTPPCLTDTPFARAFVAWREERAIEAAAVAGGTMLRLRSWLTHKPGWSAASCKIETIKAVRILTNMGLKEAKEGVENLPFVLGPYRNDDPRVLDMVANGATFDRVDAPVTTQAIYNFAPKVAP